MQVKTLLKLSVGAAVATIVMKTTAWWITDSVGLLSDAMESFVNLASALFALLMLFVAVRMVLPRRALIIPAHDARHNILPMATGGAVAGALAAAVSLADAATPDDAMTVAAALSAALEDSAAGVDSLLASLTTNVALQDALRAEDAVAWIVPNPLPPASRIYVVGPDGRSYALGRGSRVYVVARGARVVIVPGEE